MYPRREQKLEYLTMLLFIVTKDGIFTIQGHDMVELKDIPKPKSTYSFPLNITDERRQFTERRERRAKELGIPLYVLGVDPDPNDELQKLEDYIMDNFIDFDLDVPEDLKERYLTMKKERETSQDN